MAGKREGVDKQGTNMVLNRRIREFCKELEELARGDDESHCLEASLMLSKEKDFCEEQAFIQDKIDRLLRLKEVLEYIPISKSTWWAGVKSAYL